MSLNWFPLYHGDYLRDTSDLSAAEHGAYLLLLMAFFAKGPLPNDINRLCRIAAGADAGLVVGIMERYWELVEGKWTNRRMAKIREEAERFHLERSESGRKGAMTKWQKKIAEPLAEPLAEPMATTTTTTTTTTTKTKRERAAFAPPTPDEVREYAKSIGYLIRADLFCDHYAARGWKLGGGQAMKDWRAAVRTWKARDSAKQAAPKLREVML